MTAKEDEVNEEEFRRLLESMGPLSRIIKVEGVGRKISEEGGMVTQSVEQDSLSLQGFTKIIATKHNVCDCGHFGTPGSRCNSCQITMCKECSLTCVCCGRVFCSSCLQSWVSDKTVLYCAGCRWKFIARRVGRRLLGFEP